MGGENSRDGSASGKVESLEKGSRQRGEVDYEQIRDHILKNLGLGKQSQGGKALDAFIKELQRD